MHIQITLNTEGQTALPSTTKLAQISDDRLYNKERNTRHPIAIYNTSLDTALESLLNLTTSTRELLFRNNQETWEDIAEKTRIYLLDTFTHIEDCKTIIKTLYPTSQEKEPNKCLREFSHLISDFRNHIAIQANKIKHNQSKIRTIYLKSEDSFSPGYFIESMISGEALGPDPEVHPQSNSAFSYAREIRKSLCGILFISTALESTIHKTHKTPTANTPQSHPKITKIANLIDTYFGYYFPDEIYKPNPEIKIKNETITISIPSKNKAKTMQGRVRIEAVYQGDGFTRSFQIPYFKSV